MNNFSTRLKTLRKENKLTQNELALKSNISRSNINTWETGRSLPLPDGLIALANAFECSIDYLLGRESEDGTIIIESNNKTDLTVKENTLLSYFRQMNEDTKDIAIGILKGIVNG